MIDLDALDATHVQYVRPAGRGLGGCAEDDEEWPCPTRQLVAIARAAVEWREAPFGDFAELLAHGKMRAALKDAGL